MASDSSTLAGMAIRNPLFQEQAKKAAFQAIDQDEHDNDLWNKNASSPVDPATLDIDEKELTEIRKYARMLKICMIGTSTLMIITSWYSMLGSSSSLSTSFLAFYLFFFAIMLCCFELAIRKVAVLIVQNFGFMYNSGGKIVFLAFVAVMAYQISTLGKVCFALIIAYCGMNLYVQCKHPSFARYMRLMHFYNKARAGKSRSVNNSSNV